MKGPLSDEAIERTQKMQMEIEQVNEQEELKWV
jgi:hypothetical protein